MTKFSRSQPKKLIEVALPLAKINMDFRRTLAGLLDR